MGSYRRSSYIGNPLPLSSSSWPNVLTPNTLYGLETASKNVAKFITGAQPSGPDQSYTMLQTDLTNGMKNTVSTSLATPDGPRRSESVPCVLKNKKKERPQK